MSLLFWLDHFLDARAKILQIFWKISDTKNSFWNYLTFSFSCFGAQNCVAFVTNIQTNYFADFCFQNALVNKPNFQYNKKVPKKVSAALNPERLLVECTDAAKKLIWHRLYISLNLFAQSVTQSGSFGIQKMMRCGEHTWSKKRSIVYITD